ncbi:hypothetical protein OHT74_07295 [Streptomyces sp. NBC_00354]
MSAGVLRGQEERAVAAAEVPVSRVVDQQQIAGLLRGVVQGVQHLLLRPVVWHDDAVLLRQSADVVAGEQLAQGRHVVADAVQRGQLAEIVDAEEDGPRSADT